MKSTVTLCAFSLSLVAAGVPGLAANRFFIADATLVAGATNQEVPVRCENDVVLYGFSFGIKYDSAKLTALEVLQAGTAAASADFFDGMIDAEKGAIGWGCVFDTNGDFSSQHLPPGADQVIAILRVDVIAGGATSTSIAFEEVSPGKSRPVRNVMTNMEGRSIVPALQAGTITIETAPPSGERFVRGDADSNGTIELTDGIRILGFLFTGGPPPVCFDAADADDNGALLLNDAILIFGWLFQGGRAPSAPSPGAAAYAPQDCGEDPTPGDSFGCATPSAKCS
jgi:hypothetical protein